MYTSTPICICIIEKATYFFSLITFLKTVSEKPKLKTKIKQHVKQNRFTQLKAQSSILNSNNEEMSQKRFYVSIYLIFLPINLNLRLNLSLPHT